jgi:hypothetical protein
MRLVIPFTRSQYAWVMILFLVVVPILEAFALMNSPSFENSAGPLNTVIFIAIAFTTGGRLKDAGYRAWVGVLTVFAIGICVPVVAGAGLAFLFHGTELQPLAVIVIAVGLALLPLLAFVVWAATRRSAPSADERSGR